LEILEFYVVKDCPENIKKLIINKFKIDKSYYEKTKLIVIYSNTLNIFLNTFYIYKKNQY